MYFNKRPADKRYEILRDLVPLLTNEKVKKEVFNDDYK
ncbi:hypothetical protein F3D3_4069 [Fusibacter sp. 3D3]|nr:hypothetical protein F3D3_4069 [Fusibacter sp. 3D3]